MSEKTKEKVQNVSIMDAMETAMDIWKKHFKTISLVVLIVYIPTQFIIELVSIPLDELINDDMNGLRLRSNTYELIRLFIGSIATLGVLNFSFNYMSDENHSVKASEIIGHGLNHWGTYIGASLWAGLKTLLYTLMLIIPGIYKGVRLSFVDCVAATSEKGVFATCNDSESLVQGRWWYIFAFILFLFFLEMVAEVLIALPFMSLSENQIVSFLIGILVKIVTIYLVITRGVYYYRLTNINQEETKAIE